MKLAERKSLIVQLIYQRVVLAEYGSRTHGGALKGLSTRCWAGILLQAPYLAYPNTRAKMSALYYTTVAGDLTSVFRPSQEDWRNFKVRFYCPVIEVVMTTYAASH